MPMNRGVSSACRHGGRWNSAPRSGREAGTLVLTSIGDCVDDTTARIKRAIDIVALVGEYLPLTRAGAKYKGVCPFHEDHSPSLTVDPNFQSFKCWACGAGGDIF